MSHNAESQEASEQEPLLGRPGDAALPEGESLVKNFILGTAVVAQAGVWVLVAIVWGAIFSNKLILFSAHPLLNSSAVLLYTQGILILQPTHTKPQKRHGTYWHSGLNAIASLSAIAGLVIIEYNKFDHDGDHFLSPHAILGLITYIVLLVQALVGFTQFYVPALYGGEANAKSIWKYHRVSGYLVLGLMLATVCAATQTDFNKDVLGMQLWAVLVSAVLVLAGVVPRIKPAKFGL